MRYLIFCSCFLFFIYGCTTAKVAKEAGKAIKSTVSTIKDIGEDKSTNKKSKEKIKSDQGRLSKMTFIGKNQDELLRTLGEPDLIRKSGNTVSIRYSKKGCVAYAYINKNDKKKKIQYFEIRNDKGSLITKKSEINLCIDKFI